jgi:lipid II:glycine glycyltransferase (peptidoglycan interpeptide bridge formation enzyme)
VEIKKIEDMEMTTYDKFVEGQGTIFNNSGWKRHVHKQNMRYYGIYEEDKQMIGVFHLYTEKKMGMNFIKNPPYVPHIGLVYKNRSINPASALSFDKKVIGLVSEFVNGLNYGVVSIALPDNIRDLQPFTWKKYKVVPNYTYILSLDSPVADLEKRMSPEHRNSLKKALKEEVTVEKTDDYKPVKELILNTFSRKNKSLSESMINDILFKFSNPGNSFSYVSRLNSKPIAASFCLFDTRSCYYLLGGYDSELKHPGAGILCIWNSILYAKEKGLRHFDFEGSMIKEVERYFRAFGPELVPYYTVNKAKLPLEIALKFIKREQF